MIGLITQWKALAAAAAATLLMAVLALWRLEAAHARQLALQLQQAQAAQKMAQAQSAAAGDAEAVVAGGAARDQRTVTTHSENSHAIQSAEGAGQVLDSGLNAAGRSGLCAYDAYAADPACTALRHPDPGSGSAAGQSDSSAPG